MPESRAYVYKTFRNPHDATINDYLANMDGQGYRLMSIQTTHPSDNQLLVSLVSEHRAG